MSNNESFQAHSPLLGQEDLAEWAWLSNTTSAMLHFPGTSPQDPIYDSFGAEGLPINAPPMLQAPFPADLAYPPMGSDFTSALNGSPVEPFTQDVDLFMAFQPDLYTESSDLTWAIPPPENTAVTDPFTNTLDLDLFAGLDFGSWPQPTNPYTPPGSASPTTPVYDTLFFPVNHDSNSPPSPLTPISQPSISATPESTSPADAAAPLPQPLPCPNASCPAVFPTLSALRKHERKHRTSFHCPIPCDSKSGTAHSKRCTQGFLDARALHRHLWTQHKEYARAHNLPSEQVQCSVCPYTGRGDNVARHVRQRHGEGGANSKGKGKGRKGEGGRGHGGGAGGGGGLRAIQPGPFC